MIYASHKIGENFEINGIKIDVYIFHIKIMKQIFESSHNSKIGFIVKKVEHLINIYNIYNGKVDHIKSQKFFIKNSQD